MPRYQQSRHALGSDAYLTLVVDDIAIYEQSFKKLWHTIESFENRFSRFREHSELSNFNAHAGETIAVTPQFRNLLSVAKQMAGKTKGLYNPLILPALQRAGYKGSWPEVSAAPATLDYEDRSMAYPDVIELTDTTARIPQNTALDFGGIGKGYLLDLLASRLNQHEISSYWLSLGGDILCSGVDETGKPWQIAIQDAQDAKNTITVVGNKGARLAIATSGTTKRKGEGWHHIIDPRTLRPADTDVLTATVCTQSAVDADVFAKCLVIVGSENTQTYLQQWHIADALIQADGTHGNMTTKTGDAWLT